jgi:predicted nuclease of predicted toxin-antitoxin system
VITAQEDGCARMPDPELLDRARSLARILFTRDDDLLVEAVRRQRASISFAGVIFAHQMRVNIGQCIDDLHLLAECLEPEDLANTTVHLPLK